MDLDIYPEAVIEKDFHMTGNVSNAGCKLHLETGNTAGFVMIPRIQEYFGINPLVQTVTFNLQYATKVLAFPKQKFLYLNSPRTDYQSGVITITPKSQL